MNRREMLCATGAAVAGLPFVSLGLTGCRRETKNKKQKVLYFTRSAGFVHSVVDRHGQDLAYSEKVLKELGAKYGLEVVCSQDGAIFDGDIDQFACFIFYTSGDLTGKPDRPQPGAAMSPEGKKKLLGAIQGGKGFVGIHAVTDTFRNKDPNSKDIDPFLAMLGGEFLTHASQQEATMKLVAPTFPGTAGLDDGFRMKDEWYAFHKFAPDLHVILVQETAGMHDAPYQRPPYPATWARMQGNGRVFYTSMGHREDVWTNPKFQQVLLGGIAWALLRNAEADVTPNLSQVTPGADKTAK
jgi:uncharacterized protein